MRVLYTVLRIFGGQIRAKIIDKRNGIDVYNFLWVFPKEINIAFD